MTATDPDTEGAKSSESTGPTQASPGFTLALERLLEKYKKHAYDGEVEQTIEYVLKAHQESVRATVAKYEEYLIDNALDETSSSFDDEIRYTITNRIMFEAQQRLRAGLEEKI